MSAFLPTIILRHKKENLKKCSLRGLETREDLRFFTYPHKMDFSLDGYVMLHLGDENTKELSVEDRKFGLFFLDSTWNYEKKMHDSIKSKHSIIYRSLPKDFLTSYPRKQTMCDDPERGLATVEALYIAHLILGRNTGDLFNHYHFGESFLEKNMHLLNLIKKDE
jgi:pre-rRNA-processing protein TSR3